MQRIARPWGRIRAALRALLRDRKGGMTTLLALGTPLVVGAAGIGVETGLWYMTKRQAQTAADSAAVAGAIQITRGQPGLVTQSALADAARNGFPNTAPSAVAINHPPQSGSHRGNAATVEAIVSRQMNLLFASFFLSEATTVQARAVAGVQGNGNACILALDPTASGAVTNSGTTTVNSANCIVAANSRSPTAISAGGNSTLVASTLWTVGGYGQSGNSTLMLTSTPHTNMWPLADPFARTAVPVNPGACRPANAGRVQGTAALAPGVYCTGGINVAAHASVTLQPGTYHVVGADFTVNAGAIVRCECWAVGSGVTIVLSNGGTVTIKGGADVELQAPSDPAYPFQGILFYQDRNTHRMTHRAELVGGEGMALTGAIYFPATEVHFSGNNGAVSSQCIEIIARLIRFVGTSVIDSSRCSEHGTPTASVTSARLLD